MGLEDMLNRFSDNNSREEEPASAFSKLHHEPLRLSQKTPSIVARILPPAGLKGSMYAEYREWWADVATKNGNRRSLITLAPKGTDADAKDPVNGYVELLQKAGKLKNRWGNDDLPKSRYYVNVLPYKFNQQTATLEPVVTPDGAPDVYVLNLNYGQMKDLAELLKDPINNPNLNQALLAQTGVTPTQEQTSWSFTSSAIGYAVKFSRSGSPVKYETQLYSQYPLAPLPAGWESALEDINALATPSYIASPSFIDYVVKQGNTLNAEAPAEAPKSDIVTTAGDAVAAPVADWGTSVTTNTHQQPVTQAAPQFTAPQPTAPAPQPSAPQPTAPVQPASASPLAGFGAPISQNVVPQAPASDDDVLGFDEATKSMIDSLGIK